MKLQLVVTPTPADHDSDNCTWKDEQGKYRGGGYIPKEEPKVVHITRCPNCLGENYMSQPICIKCGFVPEENQHETT